MKTYRIDQSYQANYESGPEFSRPFPEVPTTPTKELLGMRVNSRVGIAAGLLLNSKWIATYARLGFDVLTYKTVRSRYRECYPPPNWVRLNLPNGLPDDPDASLMADHSDAPISDTATWAVCFGMPSMEPEVWRADVERAKRGLGTGQILNVSVVGTPNEVGSFDDLADDFARCAAWAKEAGADWIEANFSCPNVTTAEGQVYQDPRAARAAAERIRRAIGNTPLLIKTGSFGAAGTLAEFLESMDRLADAVVLVNAVQRRVHDSNGRPVFGPFERVGIVGHAIRDHCLHLVADASAIVRSRKLAIRIFGVGGASTAADVREYFHVGADAVFLGSAPMFKPTLAAEIKRAYPEL
jgi:dihydroorotate dehydrogenase